jgi:transcriptional regulator with XRE-family HTH domain
MLPERPAAWEDWYAGPAWRQSPGVRRRRRTAHVTMRVSLTAPAASVTHAPLLITELERIRRERRWTVREVARHLGVSPKLFYNMRRGYRPLSVATLSAVARDFGADYRVREAVMHYLALEYPTFGRDILRTGPSTSELPDSISYHNRWRIVTWLGRLPFGEGVQRGLYLSAAKPDALAAVSRFVVSSVERAGLRAVTVAGNARLSASHASAAADASVLVVDRIDFASDAVAAIIAQRVDAHRPTVVTSCVDREAMQDGALLRMFRAETELIRLDAMASNAPVTVTAQ